LVKRPRECGASNIYIYIYIYIYIGYEFLDTINTGGDIGLVLEFTSFYAEPGSHIFDTGSLDGILGSLQVHNTQVCIGFVLHIGNGIGGKVVCKVHISFGFHRH